MQVKGAARRKESDFDGEKRWNDGGMTVVMNGRWWIRRPE